MRRWSVLGVLLLAVLLLAGCAVGPSQRPPVAVRGEQLPAAPPTSAAGPPADPDLLPDSDPVRTTGFTDCTADTAAALTTAGTPLPAGRVLSVGCARLTVPADRDRPELGPARLGLTRVTTPGAADGRPALVVLGDTGTDGSARAAVSLAARLPTAVLDRYQVIGVDRRGAGEDLLDCAPVDARAALLDAGPDRRDEASMTALLERAREVVQDCNLLLSGTVTSYRAASGADDLESLRSVLGAARLDLLAVGDGADAAAAWIGAHPGSVGRVVLDGPGDPTLDEPARTETTTAAAEKAFDAFAGACTASPTCPLGPDPRGYLDELVFRLSRTALPVGDGDAVTAGATLRAVRSVMSQPARWPELQSALVAAGDGDPAELVRILAPLGGPQGRFDATLATRCNDSRVRVTPGEAADLAGQWAQRFPLFGVAAAQELVACGPWPSGGPVTPAVPRGAPPPPVVVIGTAQDPRSPQSGAERTAQQLATGRLVRWQGSGTGAYPRTPCVTDVVDRALLTGRAPSQPVVCPP
ncbi:alpha/beta hydrolase [Pseudonocardia alni]|uniref:Alpha/beta hydrolase n=1 Tax=Pseudonocardia alni subsp. carboxydivorans TaxID=415010 RepID=A0ABU9AE07_PSEA5